MAYLIEIDGYTLPSGPTTTLRFASNLGYTTLPSDTPANAHFAPRLAQPFLMRRDLFDRATTFGTVRAGKGQITLNNADGGLDYLLGVALPGRSVRVYQGTPPAAFTSGWALVGRAKVRQVEIRDGQVVISLADRLADLEKPLLTSKYAGNNSLPAGVEGTANDIKDKFKPRIYGRVFAAPAVHVNTSRDIYQCSDVAASITAVYDRGIALTAGSAYADLADMQANVPSASQYRVLSSAGGTYVRLGTIATGAVTFDGETSELRAASLIQQVALDAGLSAGDISSADVSALNTLTSAPVGVFVDGETTALAVVDELANAVGAWVGFDAADVLRMQRLAAPSGSPVLAIDRARILALTLSAADGERGVPSWSIRLDYQRVYSTQNDLNTAVTAARRALLAETYRTVSLDNAAIKTAWPDSTPLSFTTCLCNASDAIAEASRRAGLYGVQRQLVSVTARLEPLQAAALDIGLCVQITHPRYGLSGGWLGRVVGLETNADTGETTIRLWG